MPVFRVEKNSNYTTMCNYHLRDQGLSLKGKGLLSMLLSLPDTWNYSVRGLSSITPDGVDIFLSKDEYDELQAEYPDRLERLIEEMSHYLAASGKAYQNYAAALHRWAANDKKGAVKQGIPDYTCMEGESL